MHSEPYIHSYPYDWRTKQPVILRGSKQWFVRTDKLREKALEAVQGVKIQPESAVQGFRGTIERRPYWCISRQRAWGTFIPVIYTLDGEPVVSEELLARSGSTILKKDRKCFSKTGINTWLTHTEPVSGGQWSCQRY